jgi:predicted house-cleaning noncanonical NTP pyrophosphatase (MazG superfamily)
MPSQKWTRQKAELRYVQGDAITLEALAELSGVPLPTLKRWSAAGGWLSLRREYQDGIRDRTLEKTTDELADLLSDLSLEHLAAYQVVRRIVMAKARRILEVLEQDLTLAQIHQAIASDTSLSEELREKAMKQLDSQEVGNMARTLDICIRGERQVAGLEHEEINAAIKFVEKAGFEVKIPGGVEVLTVPLVKNEAQK